MAHYKISQRIERILALRRPGSGVLPRPAWALLFVVTLPVLYVSAAAQSGRKVPAHDVLELQQVLQPLLAPIAALPIEVRPQTAAPETPQPPPHIPAPEAAPAAPSPVQPATPQQVPPVIQPDLVGEIRLILAPVEVQLLPAPGQVEIRTNSGTSRYTGTAVWNVATNPAPPNSWNLNTFWNLGGGTVAFGLTGIEGRKALFEDRGGNTFSYGCSNCTFLVSQSGVGTMPANPDAGIAFQLSPDGRSLSATCHASECRVGSPIGNTRDGTVGGGGFLAGSLLSLTVRNAETVTVGIGKSTNGVCFNVGGNRKVDGTPFTDADCDRLPSILYFSLTR